MNLLLTPIFAALIQVASLVVVAWLVGPSEYAIYSLIIASAALFSGVLIEWIRQTIARFSGSPRFRTSTWLLGAVRQVASVISLVLGVGGLSVTALALLLGEVSFAGLVLSFAVTLAAGANIDVMSMYLRYRSTARLFSGFLWARSLVGGLSAVSGAAIFRSAEGAALSAGAASLLMALAFRRRWWPTWRGRVRLRLLARLAGVGACASTSAIATNFTYTTGRVALVAGLGTASAGAAMLALDLVIRGVGILGTALATWGTRPLYDLAHHSRERVYAAFGRVARVFLFAWMSLGILGAIAAQILATLWSPSGTDEGRVFIVLNVAAILVLGARIYLLDPLLIVIGRVQEVALSAAILAGSALIFVTASPFVDSELLALSIPMSVSIATLIYMIRNGSRFRLGASKPAAILTAAQIVAMIPFAIACPRFGPPEILAALSFFVVIDLVYFWRNWRDLKLALENPFADH